MNRRAVGAECRYILRIWTRSGSHVVMSVVMPLILLLALGFFFGTSSDPQPSLLVHDQSGTLEGQNLTEEFLASASFQARIGSVGEGADIGAWMHAQGLDGVVRIPPGFGNQSLNASLQVHVVDPGTNAGRALLQSIHRVVEGTENAPSPFAVLPVPPQPAYRAMLLPGVIGLSIVTTGVSVGFASISELRHHGLLQRLAASPLGKGEWLLGRMLGVGLVSLVSVIVLLGVSRLVFGATFTIGVWTAPLVFGGTLVFAGLGTLLGLAVERPEAGSAIMNLVLMPLLLLSGAFFDLSNSPQVLQWIALASPLTHLVDGLRADMLGTGDAALQALAMVGFAGLLLVGGARLIRWTEKP